MRIRTLHLKGFKRFDDLTIDLGKSPARVVALVGPNGCGKSCIFDAFEEKLKAIKPSRRQEPDTFFSKYAFHRDETLRARGYNRNGAIELTLVGERQDITRKSFHVRSSYRFTPSLSLNSISAQPDILADTDRPGSSIALDARLQENYARLISLAYGAWEQGDKSGDQVRKELLGRINDVLSEVLDVRVSSLGSVIQGKGQLYFEKNDATGFPYQNLGAGEKEVIDIIVDLVVRSGEYDDTVYCIDEPELHLSTAIQRKLLVAVERLLPEKCQLWIATHSVGFIRALQEELADKSAIIDLSEKGYFSGTHTAIPVTPTRTNWHRIFKTALADLAGLVAPKRVVYCEGRAMPGDAHAEVGLDAIVYNRVFEETHSGTLFVSGGGSKETSKNSSLAIKVLSKAFLDVDLLLLCDRDTKSDAEREAWLRTGTHHRMLLRRELENYLLDYDVLLAYCTAKGRTLARGGYDAIVVDISQQDLKAGQTIHLLKYLCGELQLTNNGFMRELAPYVRGTSAYVDLERMIFGAPVSCDGTAPKARETNGS